MPSLADIAAAQPTFQTFQGSLKSQTPAHVKGSSSTYRSVNEKGLTHAWKSWNKPKRVNFNVGQLKSCKNYYPIQAVATIEPKYLVHHENGDLGYNDSEDKLSNYVELEPAFDLSSSNSKIESSNGEINDADLREKFSTVRISKANKGNTPWNKGRKHSPETLQRIKERTKFAMQDPKVKMKLATNGHPQSGQTRLKIGAGVRMGWQKRRERLIIQELCLYEWQNLVAEASRRGYDGEEELQWDSYHISKGKLKAKWVDFVEPIKQSSRQGADSRSSMKSLKQRVISYGEDSSFNGVKVQDHRLIKGMRSKAPKFKDPLAESKLEMIRNIRAHRTTLQIQKTEAVERARLLIAEAEKAAKWLEMAAISSPIAQASLLETRKLIAEAKQSIESIEMGPWRISSPFDNANSAESNELPEMEPSVKPVHQNEIDHRQVNGIWLSESNNSRELDFPEDRFLTSHLSYTRQTKQQSTSGHHAQLDLNEELDKKLLINGTKIPHSGVEANLKTISGAKKWVRGRLVEAKGSD